MGRERNGTERKLLEQKQNKTSDMLRQSKRKTSLITRTFSFEDFYALRQRKGNRVNVAVVFTISKLPMDGGTVARVRRVRQGTGGRAMDGMGGPKKSPNLSFVTPPG